ncbi:MAG TPA: hypothetical protein VF862_02420 [Gemmatimonadales bacterium]
MAIVPSVLGDAIDYAGLFPPAQRTMADAVREYGDLRGSAEAWALGRFVVPSTRLDEFATALLALPASGHPWLVSVTCGGDLVADLSRVASLPSSLPVARARVDTVEFRTPTVDALLDALQAVPATLNRFAEIPLAPDPVPFVSVLKLRRAAAKFRTGGVVPEAIPDAELLLQALDAVVRAGVPFKCTAGLHHPVRGAYPLTYAPDGPVAVMHGFVNVTLAAAALHQGEGRDAARGILLETDPAAFVFTDDAVRWRHISFDRAMLRALRRRGFRSFGSCSFREPVDELAALTAS